MCSCGRQPQGVALLVDAVDALEAVGHGVADRVEPAAAPVAVVPALGEPALGVVAEEDVVRPLLVGERGRVLRVRDVGLAAVVELDLLARAAPRARDELHGMTPCSGGSVEI